MVGLRPLALVMATLTVAGAGTGLTLAAQDRPAAAFADCDTRVARDPGDHRSYSCYWTVGAKTGRWADAARRLDAILSLQPSNHAARFALAQVEASRGRDRAEQLYRAAADGYSADGVLHGEVHALLGLAFFIGEREGLDEADVALDRAASVAERSDDRSLVARVRIRQASQANRREDFGRALRLLRRVEPDVFPDGPADLKQLWFSYMAYSCWALGQLEDALDYYRREADLLRESGFRFEEAVPRRNVAFISGLLGLDKNTRLDLAREALAVAIAGGNRGIESSAHYDLSFLTEGAERIEHARRCLEIARERNTFGGLQFGLRALASSLVEVDPRTAFLRIDEAIELARRRGSLGEIARDHTVRAYMRWKTGPREAAIADSFAALDAIEAVRNLQPDVQVRARTFGTWRKMYYDYAWLVLALDGVSWTAQEDALETAFRIIERQRARTLLDELDAARASQALIPTGSDAARRAELLQEISEVQRRLIDPGLSDTSRGAALDELVRLEIEEAELRDALVRADPSFGTLRRPTFPSLEEVQAGLADDQALLSFQLPVRTASLESKPWLLVLTRRDARIHPLPDAAALSRPLLLFRGLFERRDGSEAAPAAHFYRELLEDALDDLPAHVNRLVVVPDGPLHFLPFGALRPTPEAEPLAARYRISVVPSATAWLRWSETTPLATELPALAIVDPAFAVAETGTTPPNSAERGSPLSKSFHLGRLPHARDEGRSIVRLLGSKSQLLVGEEASEHRIKQSGIDRFGVVHFAAHALVDDAHPERTAILLAPGADDEDGLLQIREIVALDLPDGQVVVLSACRSASGVIIGGEGVMGLARAFFQAGAGTVVGSLWPLRDDEAATLFDSFYRHLSKGANVASALEAAQREIIGSGAPNAAWAGVVVLGDGAATPIRRSGPSDSTRRLIVVATALAILLAGLFVFVRQRSKATSDRTF